VKIFISYLTKEKHLAGEVKSLLDDKGFETSLAHEDIAPTAIWRNSIYEHLTGCDIMLPLLTEGISKSIWCNQEIGIALGLEKLIIPIKIDKNPEGFLSQYQALKFPRDSKFPFDKLYGVIANDKKMGSLFRDFLIKVLEDSSSFIDAHRNAEKILKVDSFTPKQLEKIMKVSLNNDQIYRGTRARIILKNYMYQNKDAVDESLYKRFIENF
jgi:hypothetical protein